MKIAFSLLLIFLVDSEVLIKCIHTLQRTQYDVYFTLEGVTEANPKITRETYELDRGNPRANQPINYHTAYFNGSMIDKDKVKLEVLKDKVFVEFNLSFTKSQSFVEGESHLNCEKCNNSQNLKSMEEKYKSFKQRLISVIIISGLICLVNLVLFLKQKIISI